MFALSLHFRQVGAPRPVRRVTDLLRSHPMHDTASKSATQASGQRRSLALRFISGKYQGGEFPMVPDKQIVVGRSSDLDMVLVEDMVSRKHARIACENQAVIIEDLGSTNGTFVNGEKIKRAQLKEGDRVLIGTSILKVIAMDGPAPETARPNLEVVAAATPHLVAAHDERLHRRGPAARSSAALLHVQEERRRSSCAPKTTLGRFT